MESSTILLITSTFALAREPFMVMAFLLKLTTTLPGHLFPGPGVNTGDDAASTPFKGVLTTVAAAVVAAVLFKKVRRFIDTPPICSSIK
jgi:hypothetical protein